MFNILKKIFGGGKNLNGVITPNTMLVDVRSPQEFDSGSVKGAVNIPLERIHLNIEKFKNKENIVVFCRSGNRSSQAKSILEKNGIKNVTNGGTWQQVSMFVI